MKVVAFLSAMLGVVVGLLFGLLLWGSSPELVAPPAAGDHLSAEVLETLRDIRSLLERQPVGVRPWASADSAEPAPSQPQPLKAVAAADSVEDFRVALDEAVAALRRVAAEDGGGFSGEAVSADAVDTLRAVLAPEGKHQLSALFGCSPREVYRRWGRPEEVSAAEGQVFWSYGEVINTSYRWRHQLLVTFTAGYVSSAVLQDG